MQAEAKAARAWRAMVRAARLLVGVPDYATYVSHMRASHPDVPPMDEQAFFRERLDARFRRGRSRCC